MLEPYSSQGEPAALSRELEGGALSSWPHSRGVGFSSGRPGGVGLRLGSRRAQRLRLRDLAAFPQPGPHPGAPSAHTLGPLCPPPLPQILTQEDWNVVLYNGMASTSSWAALYFVALMTFGNYVLFNLLVAILVEGFQAEVRGSFQGK